MTNVYISPHPDDAVLSCGGRIIREKEDKKQIVINIFSKEYQGKTEWDKISGIGENPMKIRKEEEKKIMSKLGVEVFYLEFYDRAVYQDILKTSRPDNEKKEIAKEIKEIINSIEGEIRLFFPFGIGHPDHFLVAEIGREFNFNKHFYKDLPYLSDKEEPEWMRYDISVVIDKKIDYIFKYESQIKALMSLTNSKSYKDFRENLKKIHLEEESFFEKLI